MKLLKDFIDLHSFDNIKSISKENQNKLSITSIYSSFGLLVSLIHFFYFLVKDSTVFWIALAFAFLFIGCFIFTRRFLNYKLPSFAITCICLLCFITIFITGGSTGNEFLWFFIFPIFTLLIYGIQKGSILSFALFIIIVGLSFFDIFPLYKGAYSLEFKFTLLLSYITVFSLAFSYEFIRKKTRDDLIDSMIEAKKSNQTNKAKAEFMAELSHQIRTPLSSILGVANILKNTPLTEYQKELLETIDTSSNNLITVVNRLVDISELSVENDDNAVLTFDLLKVIVSSINEFKSLNPKTDLRDSISISQNIPKKLIGNPSNIHSLLNNILSNIADKSKKHAIHFNIVVNEKKETENSIEIQCEIHSNSLKLNEEHHMNKEIEYDYSGKQDEAHLKINQKFINEKDYFGAYNLSESKKIVESYGGKFGVRFIEPNISIFWFTIFLWKHKTEISANLGSTQIINEGERKDLSNLNILVVEDNIMNQKVISLALKDKVNSVDIAGNGKEALSKFANSKYDIILLDLQMPILDGYKTFAKIKEIELGTSLHTPCIALTANAMTGDKEKCMSLGMDDYISKPFQVDELLEKIYKHTRTSI